MGYTLYTAHSRPASGTACTSVCSAVHCCVAASLTRSTLPAQQQRQLWCRETKRLCTSLPRASSGVNLPSLAPTQSAATPATAAAGVTVTRPATAVALDVEYAHYLTAEGKHVSVPAWVALVDQHCALLLKTFIQHQVEPKDRWIGGVQPPACTAAPALPAVLQQLQQLTDGQLLLGHGLAKDLAALGLQHPAHLTFDTMTHPAFCNPSGNSRNLKQLARQFLAQDIQQPQQPAQQQQQRRRRRGSKSRVNHTEQPQQPQQLQESHKPLPEQQRQQQQQLLQESYERLPELSPPPPPLPPPQQHQQIIGQQVLQEGSSRSGHDPEEDAAAVMQLYQQVIFPSTYEGQVAAATARVLTSMRQRQAHAGNA